MIRMFVATIYAELCHKRFIASFFMDYSEHIMSSDLLKMF